MEGRLEKSEMKFLTEMRRGAEAVMIVISS